MDRRTFAQRATLGVAALGILQTDETQQSAVAGELPQPGVSDQTPSREPVKVNDFQALAAAKLPRATFEYISSGSADEITLRENVAAFQRVRILPPLLTGVAAADLSTTVLKQPIKMPILLAPVAGQQMYHPHGALAAARAAAAAGTVYGVSSSVGHSVEEVAAASAGPKWFQLYVPKDRAVARRLVERAERAGYQAIILTVDLGEWKDADRRNKFSLPKETMSYAEILAFNAQAWDLAISWDLFDWLRSITKLPLIIKGVLRKDDAAKAVSLGLDGIVVSNHGGRRLDGMPATIEMLPEIVETVGNRAEVYLDGGVRRGTDVLIALALGARAVLIGRPYAWALGADGEAGVSKVLSLLRDELLNAMVASGCAKVSDIQPSLLRRS
jgi:4-hydroxymandelate oxidase